MRCNGAVHAALVTEDEHPHRFRWPRPALQCGQVRTEPRLDVQPTEQILKVADGGLDLDDQQDPGSRMKGQDVAPAAVAVMIEAHLHRDLPARRSQHVGDGVLKAGVTRVEQAIEGRALPRHGNEQPGTQRGGEPVEDIEARRARLSRLETLDGGP